MLLNDAQLPSMLIHTFLSESACIHRRATPMPPLESETPVKLSCDNITCPVER